VSLTTVLPLQWRRRRLARRVPAGPLREFLEAPLPPRTADWRKVEFMVLDFETTGTDPERDEIVSAGWVLVRRGAVELGSAQRRMVRPSRAIPERSAVIHAVTDDEAARGEELCRVLADLLGDLAGRVLVAHYAPAELGFLRAACRRCLGGAPLVITVDTVQLARRRQLQRGRETARGALRLDTLREELNLPRHLMHDALGDAVATAELFLAQMAQLGDGAPVPLKSILTPT